MKKIKIISCLTTIGVMILIFSFSAQNSEESSEISRGVTVQIAEVIASLTRLPQKAKLDLISDMHNIIRKIAHFTIYASLGVSSFVMFKAWLNKSKWVSMLIAVVFCMLYAVSDELHQLAVSGRSGEIRDVLIDTSGAAVGIIILLGVVSCAERMIKKHRKEK